MLLIANSGHAFERKDFKGLCQLGQSPKDPNRSVGNKGLGFRSVLEVTSGPEIWSTGATEGGTAFVFRFDPAICSEVAAAIAALNASGLSVRLPFSSVPLVDWKEDQLERYRDRLSREHVDGPREARRFLSPYDIPLPIEGRCAAVDDLLRAGHVTVIRLPLDGASDPEWADRIRGAVRHLPNKWPDVDRAEVGVAVREGLESAERRFMIFLPTEMATGTGAHINAPFFGSLDRRRIDFSDEYNTLLLGCVADLCLDAVGDLLAGEPEDVRGQAVVDILGARGEVGGTGQSMLELVRERAAARNTAIEDRALVLCDDGWTSAAKVRAMPAVADGLEGSLTPTDTEWSHTVEGVARLVQLGEIDATWDGFLTSLLEVLPSELSREPRANTEDALETARFLPDQDGRLISASDEARVFFRPVLGIDDAADLVEMVPNSLKRCIAFIHEDIRTHEEGSKRRRTAVHKFLDGRFAGGFGREEIVRDVVLEAVPPLPAAFGSGDADLCTELMGWTVRLLSEEPSEALLPKLGGLPVACHGGWHSADEAVFGPGWPESDGDSLWELAEELGETMGQRLRRTALLRPGDPRWGLDVGRHEGLFARIGVAEGLRLSPVNPVSFWMQIPGYELPREAPTGVDQEAWEGWRAVAQQEARPRHQSGFEYSLEGVYRLPELHGAETLTPRGRRALSRLVLNSMRCWPSGWEQATVRKVRGEWSRWRITSPLKHWLSTLPWLRDSPSGERPLSERWLVPIPLLQGQQDRFRHLQPLTLDLSRELEAKPELADTLKELGLNVYPADGERIGPELLNALAAAWRAQPELAARFNVFLGQVRHAWQYFDESGELPDDAEKGRAVRENGKGVLEMPVRAANRLAALLVEATAIRRASALEERVLIDGAEWTGVSDGIRSLEDTRYRWLPAPLLAIAAHGGPNPTGAATQGWTASVDRLRGAGVIECESIVVELVAGAESIAENEPTGWWLPGDVLAVTREAGTAYENLAPAVQAMLDRQDLLKDLRLVLGAVGGVEAPSVKEIEGALDRAEIDAQAFADVRSHWAGNTGLLVSRVKPVAELLRVGMDGFESAALDADGLTRWLEDNVPQWDARKLISAARRNRDDHAMGLEAWRALGDVAQLPAWNAVLERFGNEYEPVENNDLDEQTYAHLESLRPLLQAVSRHVAIEADEPDLFPKIEDATSEFSAPDVWSKRWWEVPFSAVLDALYGRCREAVAEINAEALPGAASVGELRDALVERGVKIDADPGEVKARLGLDEAAVAARRRERTEQEKEAARKPKMMEIAGKSFEIATIDYANLLREHIGGLEEPRGPRAKDDKFTPLGTFEGGHGDRGGGAKKRKSSHRRPSPEEAQVLGIVGEMHAYRYLRKEFGGRAVQARAWVSETRLKVLPLVEGEPDGTSDGHGFDFRFSHEGIGWRVEVKATRRDEPSFDLGLSEIQSATDIARRRSDRLRWRILRVRNVLSQYPEFDWLPNPFEDGFRNRFRLHQGGMLVSYVRRRD